MTARPTATSPRSALITGASRGIGRGTAMALAARGYALTVTARTAEDLEQMADALRVAGAPKVVTLAVDVADLDALPALVATHRDAFDTMQALILNAGVGTAGPVSQLSLTRLEKTLSVNVVAAAVLIREALPLLRAGAEHSPRHGARIIGLSSLTGTYAEAGLAAYGASKAALTSLPTVNAEESAHGVMASALAPGYVRTDMSAWVTDSIPAESMIPVDDLVGVVTMLLELSAGTSVPTLVMTRSGTSGYQA